MKKKLTHAEELIATPVIELNTPEAAENFCKLLDKQDTECDLGTSEGKFDELYTPSPSESFHKVLEIICSHKYDNNLQNYVNIVETALKALEKVKFESWRFTWCGDEDIEIIETALKELQTYKAIEKEFGIDLATLSEALVFFYAKDLDCYCPHPISLYKTCGENGEWIISWLGHDYRLKDFGITWALTKDRLENQSND